MVLLSSLFLITLELAITHRSTKDCKEKIQQINILLTEDPSTPITNEMFNLLITGFNSEKEEVYHLTIETLDLLKENDLILEKIMEKTLPGMSIHERIMRRRTPSSDGVWHYLKKIDHLPVKRRGENVQRLSDEI